MPKRTEVNDLPRIVWEFSEAEFKSLLGITDPNGVLTVNVHFNTQTVSVLLSNKRNA
jgi:hypothetical protein